MVSNILKKRIDKFGHTNYNENEVWTYKERSENMSPLKKGQKLTDNPKDVKMNLRLTKQEAEDIKFCANELGTSRTAAINLGIKKLKDEIQKK